MNMDTPNGINSNDNNKIGSVCILWRIFLNIVEEHQNDHVIQLYCSVPYWQIQELFVSYER